MTTICSNIIHTKITRSQRSFAIGCSNFTNHWADILVILKLNVYMRVLWWVQYNCNYKSFPISTAFQSSENPNNIEQLHWCHKIRWLSTSARQKNTEFTGSWTEATISLVLQVPKMLSCFAFSGMKQNGECYGCFTACDVKYSHSIVTAVASWYPHFYLQWFHSSGEFWKYPLY